MWKWSLLALGLGLLFAVLAWSGLRRRSSWRDGDLAWSGLRRRSSWRDGEKLWGQVAGVSVTPVWNGADSMDGDRSPARVTLRLSLEGREVSLQKDLTSPKCWPPPPWASGCGCCTAAPPGSGRCGRTSAPGGCCGRFWRQPLWRCFSCCCWEEEPWRPSSPTTP